MLNTVCKKTLAWFIIDYFTHNLDLIEQARKNFRPQNTDDKIQMTKTSRTIIICVGPSLVS